MAILPDILSIGTAMWDIIGRAPLSMAAGADVPGRITRAPGGVALNLSLAFARLGLRPAMLTAIGRDPEGDELCTTIARRGVDVSFAHLSDQPTDRYLAIEDAGGLVAAVADARALEAADETILLPLVDGRLGSEIAPWPGAIAIDGNLSPDLLAKMAASPLLIRADLRLAPASPEKASRFAAFLPLPNATLYANLEEAGRLCGGGFPDAPSAAEALLRLGARRVLVTDGARAAADGQAGGQAGEGRIITLAPPKVPVRRVTGAGDAFMAAHVVAERQGAPRADALARALAAAACHISGETDP